MRWRSLPFVVLAAAAAAHAHVPAHAEVALTSATSPTSRGASAPITITDRLTLVADLDDDDLDGTPDGQGELVSSLARVDLVGLDAKYVGATLTPIAGRENARVVVQGKPLAWGQRVPAGASLQGVAPGRIVLAARWPGRESGLAIDVVGVGVRGGDNETVDMTRDRASLSRTPPARVDLDDTRETIDDPDALRVVVTLPASATGVLRNVVVESLAADGGSLGTVRDPKLRETPCGGGASDDLSCFATAPLRFVVDEVDRAHALVASRSVRAEVGGAIVVRDTSGKKLQAIRVSGPRKTATGPLGRYRVQIHGIVMRMSPNGAPAIGGDDAGAALALKQELTAASAAWGQCGITFGSAAQIDVKIVNPPPPYLVALGDDIGLPASGGELRLRVDGKAVASKVVKGWSTRQVALELVRDLERAGFKGSISENARISSGAAPSVDVAVRRPDGHFASVELVSSSDATLSARVGALDLSSGLHHFGDTDSVAGTLEERTLVKAVEDGDPKTIEVIVVPYFAGGGRIGESFITSDGSSLRNVVILDRAGIRARRTSLTLAHELGHVILDEPGHPDDYGVDTPTLLMDSDASDASPFGPRRITLDECARAIRQSGPAARVPLLTEWKLAPMKFSR